MEKSFTYLNSTISYRMEGSGQAVVLLHGFGEDSHIWDQQIGFLKEHCLLIIPDIPGSGKSSLLQHESTHDSRFSTHDITITDYADTIHALLEQEKLHSCIMLGHSMGGYITLAFAEKYPGKLKAFGLINSTAFADSDEKKKTRGKAIDTIEQYGAFSFLKTTIPSLFGTQFKQQHPEKVEELTEAGKAFTKEALQQYYRAMMDRPDRTDVLRNNPLPVLFITATEDAPAPMSDILLQTPLPDKSYLHILRNVGHMSMWEAPDALNDHILAFISS
jgi:pimeloyl-ACP methyl ester carboxylesterase